MASHTVLATLAGIAIVFLLFVFITRKSRKIIDSFDGSILTIPGINSLNEILPPLTVPNPMYTQPCSPNFYSYYGTCYECGQNQISEGGLSRCTNLNCKAGQMAINHKCTSCGPGTISTGENQSECTSCGAGTYQNGNGQSVCKDCEAGTYSEPGSKTCTECPPGTAQDMKGSSSCKDCPKGSYQDTSGQETCMKCPKNSYASSINSTSCTPCPPGEFTLKEGSKSILDCKKDMTVDECPSLYLNNNLSFDTNNPPKGKSKYYNLSKDNFNLLPESDFSKNDSGDIKLSKCILNKRISERSDICQNNKTYKISCGNKLISTDSPSLTQSYEFTNAKGVCVDKNGKNIPYPTTAPPGTIGSADAILGHIISCTDPSDMRTCTYQYVENNMIFTKNPCTSRNMIYDFDKEQCINSTTQTLNNKLNYCANNQVSDPITGNCVDVIKPVKAMPPNTKGSLTSTDYMNCKTIDGGDCTVVYKASPNEDTEKAATSNPCPTPNEPSNTIFNFNTYRCEAPLRSGFQDYRIQKPIIA